MPITVFSSTGCIRCEIVKKYLRSRDLSFQEHDIKTPAGNEAFKAFYRVHRSSIRRDAGGVFFPVVADGERIVQDAGASLAWFRCGEALDGAITPNNLGHGWIGGLDVSACGPDYSADFLEILRLLKAGGLATELGSDGRNPELLRAVLAEKLADRLLFRLAAGRAGADELAQSLRAAKEGAGATELRFSLDIQGPQGRLAPAETADIARLMAEATGDNRLPLRIHDSAASDGVNLFPYRTEARRWQVLAELA